MTWLLLAILFAPFVAFVFNCTCCSCEIANLTFASGSVADNFTVDSGSWSITGGNLQTTSAAAKVTYTAGNPGGGNVKIRLSSGWSTGTAINDEFRLIGAWEDANNYVYIKFLKTGASTWANTFRTVVAGVDSLVGTFARTSEPLVTQICWDGTYIRGHLGATSTSADTFAIEQATNATTFAIEAVTNSGTFAIDSVIFRHVNSTRSGCYCSYADCSAVCSEGRIASYIQAEIAGMANNTCTACADFNGTYILSANDDEDDGGVGSCERWYHFASAICTDKLWIEAMPVNIFGWMWRVRVYGTSGTAMEWQKSYGAKPTCVLSAVDLPTKTGYTGCNRTSATCVLTTIEG